MKFNQGLKTLLYLPKNSTAFTVFGQTILIDNIAIIISTITNQANNSKFPLNKPNIGKSINIIGTINLNIFL